MKKEILESFDSQLRLYDEFRLKIEKLVKELLEINGIEPHLISSRTKDKGSLSKKIETKGDKYSRIEDITDLVGLRIITYLESEIEEISNILKREFNIDLQNSIDKGIHKADQFGYKSIHFIVTIKESRCKLPEYRKFKNLKAEIQLRSILQHAWAEIEHDLGYKGEHSIPDPFRRSFSRIAALLETADIEFDRLKQKLMNYEKEIGKLIKSDVSDVELNQASLLSFLKINKTLRSCTRILKLKEITITPNTDLKLIIQKFDFFNIHTLST